MTTPSQYMLLAVAASFGAVERKGLGDFDEKGKRHRELQVDRPCSNDNSWHLMVPHATQHFWFEARGGSNIDGGELVFHDSAGGQHRWLVQMEGEDESCRCIIADSDALAVALGERLVRLFGGELEYNSRHDGIKPLRVRKPRLALPAAGEADANEVFHLFQNAVGELRPLTAGELRDAAKRASYGASPPALQNLLGALEAQSLHDQLDAVLDVPSTARSKPRM